MDEPWNHYAMWKKSVIKYHVTWFHLHERPRISKSVETEKIISSCLQQPSCLGFRCLEGNGEWLPMSAMGFLLGWWKCCKIDYGHDYIRFGVKVELSSPPGKIEKTCTLLPKEPFNKSLPYSDPFLYPWSGWRIQGSQFRIVLGNCPPSVSVLSVDVSIGIYLYKSFVS